MPCPGVGLMCGLGQTARALVDPGEDVLIVAPYPPAREWGRPHRRVRPARRTPHIFRSRTSRTPCSNTPPKVPASARGSCAFPTMHSSVATRPPSTAPTGVSAQKSDCRRHWCGLDLTSKDFLISPFEQQQQCYICHTTATQCEGRIVCNA